MTKVPTMSPQQLIRALLKAEFERIHQCANYAGFCQVSRRRIILVPLAAGDLHRGLLTQILKQARLSEQQFLNLL